MKYFLGIDVGGTKTHALIVDEACRVVGFGVAGPGNHETVGYEGLAQALKTSAHQAAESSGISLAAVSGAGFGIAGFDWLSEYEATLQAVQVLGLTCPIQVCNDAVLGLMAGTPRGWGVNLIAGTSNNCYGRDRNGREGRVSGAGMMFGEFGGAYEILVKAIQAVNYQWIRRGPETQLTRFLCQRSGMRSNAEFIESLATDRIQINPAWVLDVFTAAEEGDAVAADILHWAGSELGEQACAVIRQLDLEEESFDLVLSGSLFKDGERLIEPIREKVSALAAGVNITPLEVLPVVGAVILGMDKAGAYTDGVYERLKLTTRQMKI